MSTCCAWRGGGELFPCMLSSPCHRDAFPHMLTWNADTRPPCNSIVRPEYRVILKEALVAAWFAVAEPASECCKVLRVSRTRHAHARITHTLALLDCADRSYASK
jgi:hypothetical protein